MDLKLAGKVVLVTGASAGIGFETLRQFLREGAFVVACARGQKGLDRAASALVAEGFEPDRFLMHAADVVDERAVLDLAKATEQRFGRLDILVANAGQARLSTFASTLDEDWEAELRLKFFSIIRPVRAFLPMLKASGAAAVVVVNSLLARQPEPHMVCTSAARAGVQNLVKSLSVELAPAIRVNAILLGTVNSGQWERRYKERARDGQSLDDWLAELAAEKHIPLGRFGHPEEPAAAIVFLSSPLSGFTTGAALEVAGGVSRFA